MKLLSLFTLIALVGCNSSGGGGSSSRSDAKSSQAMSIVTGVTGTANQELSSFKMTLYKVYVSENEDCSSLSELADFGSGGKTVDLMLGDSLVSADLLTGTYRCIAITMDRRFQFQPDSVPAGTGSCVAGSMNDSYIGSRSLLAEAHTNTTYSLEFPVGDALTGIKDSIAGGSKYGGFPAYSSYEHMQINGTWVQDPTWVNAEAGTPKDNIPMHHATLYLSSKVRTVTDENQFAPLWAYYMEEDGDEIVGNAVKVFDWGTNQDDMGAYMVQPVVVTGGNQGTFTVRLGSGVDIVRNDISGECRIQNVEFDFESE